MYEASPATTFNVDWTRLVTVDASTSTVVYTVKTTPKSPQDARAGCPSGQKLATVRSAKEEALLEKVIAATSKSSGSSWNALWLGGKWNQAQGKFRWDPYDLDMSYTKWASRNGNTGSAEPWLCFSRAQMKWHDCHGRQGGSS